MSLERRLHARGHLFPRFSLGDASSPEAGAEARWCRSRTPAQSPLSAGAVWPGEALPTLRLSFFISRMGLTIVSTHLSGARLDRFG